MNRKDLFTVSEFAKLRGVTPETLRHYDRIGLLKPAFIDPDTNYRYYSIIQYEKLGTIKELRQLGLPLEMIADYFDDRNLQKSISILEKGYEIVLQKKKEINQLEKIIENKLKFIRSVSEMKEENIPRVLNLEERFIITSGNVVSHENDLSYEWTMLEGTLSETSPILASNRIGFYVDYSSNLKSIEKNCHPFVFVNEDFDGQNKITEISIPKGKYLDVYVRGYANQQKGYDILEKYIKEKKLKPEGKVIVFYPADITVTDVEQEGIVELQVKVG